MTEITEFNKDNADIDDFVQKSSGNFETEQLEKNEEKAEPGKETSQFPAYKEDPIML